MAYNILRLLEEASRLLDGNLTLSLAQLADRLHVHRHTLHAYLLTIAPEGFFAWRRAKRFERAKTLLTDHDLPVKQVAAIVGLSPARLASLFRQCVGMTPTAFRRYRS